MITVMKTQPGAPSLLVETHDETDKNNVRNVEIVWDSASNGVTHECFDALNEAANARGITMDGAQARISGRCNKFANVFSVECPFGVEYAWETVATIVNTGTEFEC